MIPGIAKSRNRFQEPESLGIGSVFENQWYQKPVLCVGTGTKSWNWFRVLIPEPDPGRRSCSEAGNRLQIWKPKPIPNQKTGF